MDFITARLVLYLRYSISSHCVLRPFRVQPSARTSGECEQSQEHETTTGTQYQHGAVGIAVPADNVTSLVLSIPMFPRAHQAKPVFQYMWSDGEDPCAHHPPLQMTWMTPLIQLHSSSTLLLSIGNRLSASSLTSSCLVTLDVCSMALWGHAGPQLLVSLVRCPDAAGFIFSTTTHHKMRQRLWPGRVR